MAPSPSCHGRPSLLQLDAPPWSSPLPSVQRPPCCPWYGRQPPLLLPWIAPLPSPSPSTSPMVAQPSSPSHLCCSHGTLDNYANWRAWIRMDHKVALMDPSRYGRLDQVSGLLMLAKRTSSNHTKLVYPRL
ncbi:uncharacterized protein [Zea mays]|uniref:uncharacterized protein isoform X1 n=1 Tax=Zea mays TaxID=4577 RepID=UPI0004DE9C99|nr:uncharacterized protein LOC103641668 isoform X1 [Zea mays]|eukprot:XP_008663220.1 uncharacterized protein LOC103641668 isoform X1 [Zea mays]